MEKNTIEIFLAESIASLLEESVEINANTVLLGKGSILSSLMLVALLVQVEDFCLDNGIAFDWTTDSAMSEKRSHYRTVSTLTEYLYALPRGVGAES